LVVVKVQRPNIRRQIAEDFEVLEQVAAFFDAHTEMGRRHRFASVLEEFRQTIQQELNYESETQNLITVGENLKGFPLIVVPRPVRDLSTRCVLTMDRILGRKITQLGPLARLDLNGAPLTDELFKAYLKQVLVDGIFHADPHPGNVFVTDDGRIALLDLGMVGRMTPKMQETLLKLLLAISTGNGDDAAELVIHMSEKSEDFDATTFRRHIGQLVAQHQDQGLSQLNVGRTLLSLSKYATDTGLFVPSELTLLGKTMLQLDEIGRLLDPTFDAAASVRRNVEALVSQRMNKDMTKSNFFGSLLEMKGFIGHLPQRLNGIMDAVANAELEVRVKAVDAKMVMAGTQKIANRITSGLLLAALIIGASLLMRVETSSRIFGYPSLAILCFIAAAGGAVCLLITIFIQDRKDSEKR
jgi:predicted unusual protein kinase regulating ubiquinone biosynthesis (AarF/ABC1/UbiB family)